MVDQLPYMYLDSSYADGSTATWIGQPGSTGGSVLEVKDNQLLVGRRLKWGCPNNVNVIAYR